MSKSVFGVGSIHIIESLPPGDLRTGERLLDEIEHPAGLVAPGISCHYWRTVTRDSLLVRLEAIKAEVAASGRSPIVHIEAHGTDDETGLVLASGEWVPWSVLKIPLTAINITCRLNLLVVVAACNGRGLLETVQATDRAPVWGLIGPNRIVTAGELEVANREFYRTLFATLDGGTAWRAMNDAIDPLVKTYSFFGAEAVFRFILAGYFAREGTPEAISARQERILKRLIADGLKPDVVDAAKAGVSEYLSDHWARFDEAKAHFFFSDLCPNHQERFGITLDQCLHLA